MGNEETSSEASSEVRDAILKSARNRFLHYGYKKTTIDEIAADAGIGKGTVYLYFCTKEEILTTIAREVKRNVTQQMEGVAQSIAPPEERLRRMILVMILSVHDACQTTAHGIELVDEMLRPTISRCAQDERNRQISLLAGVLKEGMKAGDLRLPNSQSAEQTATYLLLGMVSFFPPYLHPCHEGMHCRISLESRASGMLDFLFMGLRVR
jgi:AcrR family transcriptional regulator